MKTKKAKRAAVKRNPGDELWVTREGKVIRLRDMDDKHLLNSMRLLERRALSVINQTPDMAGVACTRERILDITAELFPVYESMKEELESRLNEAENENPAAEIIGKVGRVFDLGSN